MAEKISPDGILQLGLGFWGAKALLSAVELGLFTTLAKGPREGAELARELQLHERSWRDFFDALVALGMLKREGMKYSNTLQTDLFLDRAKHTYVGGILEMANARLYPFWANLTEGLKTGTPQNEIRRSENLFEALYSDPARLKQFLASMTGLSLGCAQAIAAKFPWKDYKTFADIGCAQGGLPVQVAMAHPHLSGIGFDLPVVQPIFEEYVRSNELESRLKFVGGDMFKAMPKADVLVMGHILHDWDLREKRALVKNAYDGLPVGGALIVFEALIDDERKQNAFGLLMSLNMLIETSGGFDYTGADGSAWMKEAGFKETRVEHLAGPDSMVIGIK